MYKLLGAKKLINATVTRGMTLMLLLSIYVVQYCVTEVANETQLLRKPELHLFPCMLPHQYPEVVHIMTFSHKFHHKMTQTDKDTKLQI